MSTHPPPSTVTTKLVLAGIRLDFAAKKVSQLTNLRYGILLTILKHVGSPVTSSLEILVISSLHRLYLLQAYIHVQKQVDNRHKTDLGPSLGPTHFCCHLVRRMIIFIYYLFIY